MLWAPILHAVFVILLRAPMCQFALPQHTWTREEECGTSLPTMRWGRRGVAKEGPGVSPRPPLDFFPARWWERQLLRPRETGGVAHASLRVGQRSRSLSEAKAFGAKVLGVARLAVNLAVLVRHRRGLQPLATLGASKALLVPWLPAPDDALGRVHGLVAARALLGPAELPRPLGGAGLPTAASPAAGPRLVGLDAEVLARVHAERPRALPVAVALGAMLLGIAGLAEDLRAVRRHRRAVQVLTANLAQKAGLVEAAARALHLLRVVHALVAHATRGATAPLRHCGHLGL